MDRTPYILEKTVWSSNDFDYMGWHDSYIHGYAAISEEFKLLFDIDYILEWVEPSLPDKSYWFWIAPATLVFENVWDVKIELSSQCGELTLQNLTRSDEQLTPNKKMRSWLWILDGNEGSIRFRATEYKQYFRRQPIITQAQKLNYAERVDISFGMSMEG